MTSAKRFLMGAVVGVWGLIGLSSVATSQEYYSEPSPNAAAGRAEWEQKMVRRPAYARTATRSPRLQAESYGESLEAPRRTTRGGARQVAYYADGEPAAKALSPTPDPTVIGPRKPGQRIVAEGEMPYLPEVGGGEYIAGQPCAECGEGGEMGGEYFCDDGCCGFGPMAGGLFRHMTISVGAHGFKGPLDSGRNGNFGFQEGIELAGPLGGLFGDGLKPIGYQLGVQAYQSNFHGDRTSGTFRSADHNQVFLTAGIFRRAVCSGLQWAVDFDLLHDNYQQSIDYRQIRTELSIATSEVWDFGFWGAFGGNTQYGTTAAPLETLDIYTLFVRKYFDNGGEGRLWGGSTNKSDGLLGLEITAPLSNALALQNEFTFMIPGNPTSALTTQQREGWSVAMNLVWYIGRSAACRQADPFRPLLPLAGNNYFFVDRQ